jgi:hypothetical protein
MLLKNVISVEVANKGGRTPLFNAIIAGNHVAINMLIDHGADFERTAPLAADNKPVCPLLLAAHLKDEWCIRTLLRSGVSILASDPSFQESVSSLTKIFIDHTFILGDDINVLRRHRTVVKIASEVSAEIRAAMFTLALGTHLKVGTESPLAMTRTKEGVLVPRKLDEVTALRKILKDISQRLIPPCVEEERMGFSPTNPFRRNISEILAQEPPNQEAPPKRPSPPLPPSAPLPQVPKPGTIIVGNRTFKAPQRVSEILKRCAKPGMSDRSSLVASGILDGPELIGDDMVDAGEYVVVVDGNRSSVTTNPKSTSSSSSSSSDSTTTTTCTICSSDIEIGTPGKVVPLPRSSGRYVVCGEGACGHSFHFGCITRWLLGEKDEKDLKAHSQCPNCRTKWRFSVRYDGCTWGKSRPDSANSLENLLAMCEAKETFAAMARSLALKSDDDDIMPFLFVLPNGYCRRFRSDLKSQTSFKDLAGMLLGSTKSLPLLVPIADRIFGVAAADEFCKFEFGVWCGSLRKHIYDVTPPGEYGVSFEMPSGKKWKFEVCKDSTVLFAKYIIKGKAKVATCDQKITFDGTLLADDRRTLASYGMGGGSVATVKFVEDGGSSSDQIPPDMFEHMMSIIRGQVPHSDFRSAPDTFS